MRLACFHIASLLGSEQFLCIRLAHELNASAASVAAFSGLSSGHFCASYVYDMLCRWQLASSDNPGMRLYSALIAVERSDIAKKFEHLLLAGELLDIF